VGVPRLADQQRRQVRIRNPGADSRLLDMQATGE
jgi:hypothetical protein